MHMADITAHAWGLTEVEFYSILFMDHKSPSVLMSEIYGGTEN